MNKEQPSITEIAACIGSTRQNARKMLEGLAVKGYVQLAVNPQDKRNLSVTLTAQTHGFFTQFDDKGTAFLEKFFNGISPELLGSTERYAQWIAEELGADLMEADKTKPSSLQNYNVIVYGGGLYAGGVNGISLLIKNFDSIKDKALYLFTVAQQM